MNILVNCRGFIGDILFASSVAKKLKEKYADCVIHYQIPLVQPLMLLEHNPYIDAVFVSGIASRIPKMANYNLIVNIPEVDQTYPATIQFQAAAGIEDQSTEFPVYTVPAFDIRAKEMVDELRQAHGKKIIAWQVNWDYRAYQCTPALLANRIGAPHRDIASVIRELDKDYIMVPIGFDRSITQFDPLAANAEGYAKTASVVKYCDYFIGSEGGLSNLAAGVGTKCIITTDFIQQLYGPNGHVKQIANPQMGPAVYFPNGGHTHLDPCIPDADLAPTIKSIVK